MSRIMEAWETLLRQAIDREDDTRQYAIFQIALILERHYQPNQDAPTLYEENLSRDLLRLTLSQDRQRDAVQYLLQLATNYPDLADAYLYGVACANPALSLSLLLAWLTTHAMRLKAPAIYEVLRVFRAVRRRNDVSEIAQLQGHEGVIGWLEAWADHEEADLADHAESLLEWLDNAQGS